MPTVAMTDIFHVLVDGTDVGHVIDAVRSNPPRADPVEMKAAFDMWFVDFRRDTAESIAAAKSERNAALAQLDEQDLAHEAAVAKLEADIAILGTKPEAQAMRKANQRAKLQAELAALDKP